MAMDIDKAKYDVFVVSPRNHFLFTPLLPSTAVGTLEFRSVQEPVRSIPADIHFYLAKVDSIEFDKKKVSYKDNYLIDHNYSIDYDYLVLAPGCDSNTFSVPGVSDNPQVFFLK